MAEVKDVFRPEFINRVDDLIVFHALEPQDIQKIAGLMLGSVTKRLMGLVLTAVAVQMLLNGVREFIAQLK